MPVTKCSNGKYRIGHGKCMYKSKSSAERAYKGYLGSKYMTKKINEKTNLKTFEKDVDTKNSKDIEASDLSRTLKLAGVKNDIESGNKKHINFIGSLHDDKISEEQFSMFKIFEKKIIENNNEHYNIGDEVETPFGNGIIQQVNDNTCLVKHNSPSDEHGDPVEVEMNSIHCINEANVVGNITYFTTDTKGIDAIQKSSLQNEIKYKNNNVMALPTNKIDDINNIVTNIGSSLRIKESSLITNVKEAWTTYDSWKTEPPEEPSDSDVEYAYDNAEDDMKYSLHYEYKDIFNDIQNNTTYNSQLIDNVFELIDELSSVGNKMYGETFEDTKWGWIDANENTIIDIIKNIFIKSKLLPINIIDNVFKQYNNIKNKKIVNNSFEGFSLSKNSYDRIIIEMIIDRMKTGKTSSEIAEELSFNNNDVSVIYETILNLKKK